MRKPLQFERKIAVTKRYMEIIQIITAKILSGELRAGDKLPTEQELMEQLGVSRTPIREAIKILEAMGIILIKRGEGMFIQKPDLVVGLNPLIMRLAMAQDDVAALIRFRQYFEQMLIEMAFSLCDESCISTLTGIYDEQKAAIDTDDHTWAELDVKFHYTMLAMTKNPFVIEIGRTVYELFRSKIEQLAAPATRTDTLETHDLYIRTLRSEDPADLEALKKHIEHNYNNLIVSDSDAM